MHLNGHQLYVDFAICHFACVHSTYKWFCLELDWKHPSIIWDICLQEGRRHAGSYTSCLRAVVRVDPELVASQLLGTHTQTTNRTHSHTLGQFGVFNQPTIHIFWKGEGGRSAQRNNLTLQKSAGGQSPFLSFSRASASLLHNPEFITVCEMHS